MCEFKIFISKETDSKKIIEDVIEVAYRDGRYTFMDVLGVSVELKNVLIKSISVREEKIELIEHPLISSFLELIQADLDKNKKLEDAGEIAKLWEKFKTKGDKIFLS